MKYKDFKAKLDKVFDDDDDIFLQERNASVTFYKVRLYKVFNGREVACIEFDPDKHPVEVKFAEIKEV